MFIKKYLSRRFILNGIYMTFVTLVAGSEHSAVGSPDRIDPTTHHATDIRLGLIRLIYTGFFVVFSVSAPT